MPEAPPHTEERFRMLANHMDQLAWTCDELGLATWYNQRWYAYTGTTFESMRGDGWKTLHHPDHIERVVQGLSASLRSGEPWEDTFPLRGASGEYRWFLSRATPIRDERGTVVGWFGTNTDITEQREAQDELCRMNEDLRQFAYSVSHDLQEPLRTISNYTALLVQRHGGELQGDAAEFLGLVQQASLRLQHMVRDLLAYTRLGTEGQAQTEADAEEALARALDGLRAAVEDSGATITHDPLPLVRVPPAHLQLLFQNVLGNALKYRGDAPPAVHVAAERLRGHWSFSVRDNGIGVPESQRERIFGLFKRLHGPEKYPGTGMGLAICRKIVERHGGSIWVEPAPGGGADFRFLLPA